MNRLRGMLGDRTLPISLVVVVIALGAVAAFLAISLLRTAPAAAEPSSTPLPTPSQGSSAAAATSEPSVSETFTIDEGALQALVDGIRVRVSPTTTADPIAALSRGQVLWATGRAERHDGFAWVEIKQEPSDRLGWVAAAGPDGDPWLAIVHDGPIGITAGADVQLMDPTSKQRTSITSGMRVDDLAFAPDGTQVALLDPFHGPQVVAIDAMTRPEPTEAPTGPAFGPPAMMWPAFAPNGDAVAFLEGQDFLGLQLIWLGDGDPPAIPTPATLHPLSWAPDSQHITSATLLETYDDGAENWEIVVAGPGDSDLIHLTHRPGIDVSPAWSPDGSTIAYLQALEPGELGLALMDADGSHRRTLLTFDGVFSTAAQPAWSPDGSFIAIAQSLEGYPAVVYLANAHTSEHLSIPAPSRECSDLTWSPTGTRIAFVCMDDQGRSTAYFARVGDPNVVELGRARHVDWARTLEPLHVGETAQ